jgi:farnesyl-diphosphate farnesyltransferase
VFARHRLDDQWLIENGIRFGKGLQLVNVLRDVPADLRKGRCYLPASGLSKDGLQPRDLMDPATESRVRPLYDSWLGRAQGHLAAGWAYTCALPWRAMRIRVACTLPILIGQQTLKLLQNGRILDPSRRIKVDRHYVKRALYRSVLLYSFPPIWKRLGSSD